MIWAFITAAWAGELALQIDTRELVVGQAVPVKLAVINGKAESKPQLPVGEGLLAQYQGQSSQHMMVNFETTRILSNIRIEPAGMAPPRPPEDITPVHRDPQTGRNEMRQPGSAPTPPTQGVLAGAARSAAAGDTFDSQKPDTWGKVSRNAPCPCGSGKKFKHCHGSVSAV